MINILYITSTLQRSGPSNQLSYIIKGLDRTKFTPIVLTLSPEPSNSLKNHYVNEIDVKVITLGLSRIEGVFKSKSKVLNIISENDIDIIHTQGFRADVLSSTLNIPIPKLATIRNYPKEDFSMTYGKFLGFVMTKFQLNALKKINICVGVSNAVRDNLINNCGIKNTKTIRNGVDIDKYIPINCCDEKNKIRDDLSIPKDKVIWLSSIGKDKRKDSTIIAKAFKKLVEKNSKHFIIFIGDGELKSECEHILSNIENKKFTGKIDNVRSYMQVSDYFISSSTAEGLPNAVLEAMSCSVPVILSDIKPHKEIIQLDNNSGELFKTGSFESLYTSMEKIYSDDHNQSSTSARYLIEEHLSLTSMSDSYQDEYKRLLEVN